MPRRSRSPADDVDGALVFVEIARRVLGGRRRFAQHVVGEREASRLPVAAVSDRLLDRAAGDELLAHQAHGDVDAGADDRLPAAGDEASQRRRQALLAGRRHQTAGQHQAPGGGVDEHGGAVADMRAPVAGRELVADQRIARGGVGDAQQRLGEAHQRNPLLARQRIFVHQALDPARPGLGSEPSDQSAGQRLDPPGLVRARGREFKERRQALRLRAPVGRGDGGPERRLRANFGAERGEDIGGVGHHEAPGGECPCVARGDVSGDNGNPMPSRGPLPMSRLAIRGNLGLNSPASPHGKGGAGND